ncbi:MAG: FeoB-associated Cys-rich membrane protein [Clostridiales bacterium]|nr:FeoB-associated Cys-rich membrane protein [Clostridiales bacterium]
MDWLISNLATVVIGLLLLVAVIFAVRALIKGHKHSGCSGGCAGCSCAGKCAHTK